MKTYCILYNIRSVYNVGSFFRTADAVGIAKIYLTGYTPTPLDRFGRERGDVAKVALGAERRIPWEQHTDIIALITKLKNEGVRVASIEQSSSSVDYKNISKHKDTAIAFIFGNEVDGIDKHVLASSDSVFEIPMSGEKESLNVAVTAGIILFERRDGK